MSQVIEINDVDELAGYRLLWSDLLSRTRDPSFFLSLDWLEVYCRHAPADEKLRVMVVESCGKTIGIVPMVVRTEASRVGPIRVLTYPLADWGSFYGPIGPNPTASLLAAFRHVRRTRRDWDLLEPRWVNRSGADRGRTPGALSAAGFRTTSQQWTSGALVETSGDWQAYWMSRASKWRNNIRRCERKLAARGELDFVCHRSLGAACGDGDPRWELYEEAESIARRSWQGSATNGTTLSHDDVRPFLRDAHRAATRAGAVDLNLLRLNGRPVAFAYNYRFLGRVFGLRMGFDPSLRREGTGSVMLARCIRNSFDQGDSVYDLGPGSLANKRYWRTANWTSYRYSYFAPRTRPQLIRMKRWCDLRRGVASAVK